jgi:hypothetical protein
MSKNNIESKIANNWMRKKLNMIKMRKNLIMKRKEKMKISLTKKKREKNKIATHNLLKIL